MTGSATQWPNPQVLAKLLARTVPVGDCLLWTGPPARHGYGQIRVGSQIIKVHRAAWMARHGLIPADSPLVLHECDVPLCIADAHLRVGTQAENMADRSERGRHGRWNATKTHCPKGHEYSEENTRVRNGRRNCRACGN